MWLACARRLYGRSSLPAGSFDALCGFARVLADAVAATSGTRLVAPIPVAGRDHRPGGQAALRRLGNLLGGVEANWPVASTEESVDIERRRVFEPVAVDAARAGKMVTASYGEHHATRARQFPCECRARDYPRVESVTAYTASRSPVPSSRITSTDSSATGPSWLPADPRSPGPHGQSYPQTVDVQQCQPEARRPTRASDMRATRRLVWLSP